MIFATSFGYMDPTLKVAKEFPDIKFDHITGYKRAPNMATGNIRFYEGRYVQGVVAGLMTKSNKIGYIASFPIPEVIQGINAFGLGLRSVNKDAEVSVIWVNTWFDPVKEADAAKVHIAEGADILAQHTLYVLISKKDKFYLKIYRMKKTKIQITLNYGKILH